MFKHIRYQTGEAVEIAQKMRKSEIPCLDVDDNDDFIMFTKLLEKQGITEAKDIPRNPGARDRIKEPEFEFRAAFYDSAGDYEKMFIDVYFEPDIEETYDSVGEM